MGDDEDGMPWDPEYDDVPVELVILAGTSSVDVIDPETGKPEGDWDVLVLVPGLFGHARRLEEGLYDGLGGGDE